MAQAIQNIHLEFLSFHHLFFFISRSFETCSPKLLAIEILLSEQNKPVHGSVSIELFKSNYVLEPVEETGNKKKKKRKIQRGRKGERKRKGEREREKEIKWKKMYRKNDLLLQHQV